MVGASWLVIVVAGKVIIEVTSADLINEMVEHMPGKLATLQYHNMLRNPSLKRVRCRWMSYMRMALIIQRCQIFSCRSIGLAILTILLQPCCASSEHR